MFPDELGLLFWKGHEPTSFNPNHVSDQPRAVNLASHPDGGDSRVDAVGRRDRRLGRTARLTWKSAGADVEIDTRGCGEGR